ncbi:autotransporter outer membrane beta-barrel domain-containing protein [Ochrobactrum intermedium]|uniref:autotransporter family protein n=1 Tax=Brucella intermedia TaxID=94625 RepID=UPI00128B88C4|nr:autotransporter outer membrane beta-barrel domain-containing protein [Brucella intermedia]MPR64353.1 autotransporter outer membrane beta-barrel domain-containing protein [Brucella intermedia]
MKSSLELTFPCRHAIATHSRKLLATVSFAPLSVSIVGFGCFVLSLPAIAQTVDVTGSNSISTPPTSPVWNAGENTIIGSGGTGGLGATNGQVINGTNFVFGSGSGDVGTSSLADTGTALNASGSLTIGDAGTGTLYILNGAVVTNSWNKGGTVPLSYSVTVGEQLGSYGVLRLAGLGTKLTITGTGDYSGLGVGLFGKGEMHVEDGAIVETGRLRMGFGADSDGLIKVSGAGSELKVTNPNQWLVVGVNGQGRLLVEQSGAVDVAGYLRVGEGSFPSVSSKSSGITEVLSGGSVRVQRFTDIAYFMDTTGSVRVDGTGSSFTSDGLVTIGRQGIGTVSVANSGVLVANSGIALASNALGTGTLNVGTGGESGVVDTSTITGGPGSAKVNFNHTDDIVFSPRMTGSLVVNQIGSGTTTLLGSNDYMGLTTVDNGILYAGADNVFSMNSDHVVNAGGRLDLNGHDQIIASLQNAGNVYMGGKPGTKLTTTGNYIGYDGLLTVNTKLGDDTSPTDMLVVQGDTAGSTKLSVKNSLGSGAPTNEGIKIVKVGGVSDGEFALKGDYAVNKKGAVVAGAYAYQLYKGNRSGTENSDWFLRSEYPSIKPNPDPVDPDPVKSAPEPLYQTGVPSYEAYPQALLGLNGISSLQQRVGNRFWAGKGNTVIEQGADAIQPYAAPEETGVHIEGNGVWGRIEGSHNHLEPRFSTSGSDYNQNVFKMQAGVDGILKENENGKLIGGVFVHYVHSKAKTYSRFGDGEIATDGYGFGSTLTWYGNEGFYVDAQAHATWYNSDLSSISANLGLNDGNDGFGYALSIESGNRFEINPEWSVTPQGQLIYSSIDFDNFTDAFGAPISLDKGDGLQGRLGITLDHETSWQNDNGMLSRSHFYGIANLYYEFMDGTKVDVAGVSFASMQDRARGGIGIGGSYNWDDDKYSIYGEGLVNTSLHDFGDSYTLKGNVGFRVNW